MDGVYSIVIQLFFNSNRKMNFDMLIVLGRIDEIVTVD